MAFTLTTSMTGLVEWLTELARWLGLIPGHQTVSVTTQTMAACVAITIVACGVPIAASGLREPRRPVLIATAPHRANRPAQAPKSLV